MALIAVSTLYIPIYGPGTTPAINTTGAGILAVSMNEYNPGYSSFSDSYNNTWIKYDVGYSYFLLCINPKCGPNHTVTSTDPGAAIVFAAWNDKPLGVGIFSSNEGSSPGSLKLSGTSLAITGIGSKSGTASIGSGFVVASGTGGSGYGYQEYATMAYKKTNNAENPTWSISGDCAMFMVPINAGTIFSVRDPVAFRIPGMN